MNRTQRGQEGHLEARLCKALGVLQHDIGCFAQHVPVNKSLIRIFVMNEANPEQAGLECVRVLLSPGRHIFKRHDKTLRAEGIVR